MRILCISLMITYAGSLIAKDHDPNSYFKNRKWTVDGGSSGKLLISTEYVAEPVMKPNLLTIKLKCPKTKRTIVAVKDFRYCGVDSVTIQGDKIELLLVDYDSSDSRGYCMKKRKQLLPLPSCKKSKKK